MSLGLNTKFNILEQSPHDLRPSPCTGEAEAPSEPGMIRWLPSRYAVRAATDDGRLVLWNSFRGTMSVFNPEQRAAIEMMLSRKGFEAREEGAVKYLYDRGFLVKDGTDEFRRFRLAFGRQHYNSSTLQLILLASEDCNFRCQYCYEEFARGTMQPEVRENIKKLFEKRIERGLKSFTVSWFGGEPLYGFAAIEDLAPYFLQKVEENDIYYHSSMTTNGYLLTPEVADKLLAWKIAKFQITIDGPPESHNCSRPARDGGETFATIFENLKSMSRRPDEFVIDIRVNFDRNNYPLLGQFLETLEGEFGGDTRFKLRFRSVGRWGGSNDENLDVCGKEEAAQAKAELKHRARQLGLHVTDDIREVKGFGAQVCYAARPYNYIIGASGKVMKCTIDLDMKDRNVVGRVTDDGEFDLDADKLAMWTEPAFEHDKKCQKCIVLPACQGLHCPIVRFDHDRSPCTPLRLNYKKELREVVRLAAGDGRKVNVQNERMMAQEESAAGGDQATA